MISTADIVYLLSGGSTNTNPLLSLGGDPSATPITSQLFNNLTTEQTTAGYTDYRCFYIANDNGVDALYAASVYIDNETTGGVPVEYGFIFQNDIQQINISLGTTVTSGSMVLQYEGTNFTVPWASTADTWAAAFQTAIRTVPNLQDVLVTGGVNGSTMVFQINFVGAAANRFHALLQVVSDSGLVPIGTGHITILKVFDGGPINSIAAETDAVTTAPNGVLFYTPSPLSPLLLGDLRVTDHVPVWVKRICPPLQPPVTSDGFALKLIGNPFPGG